MTDEEILLKIESDLADAQYNLEVSEQENERLKTELAEVKRFLQEMYSNSNFPGSNYTIPTLWRQRIERFVK